jgi:hypothetical protein
MAAHPIWNKIANCLMWVGIAGTLASGVSQCIAVSTQPTPAEQQSAFDAAVDARVKYLLSQEVNTTKGKK